MNKLQIFTVLLTLGLFWTPIWAQTDDAETGNTDEEEISTDESNADTTIIEEAPEPAPDQESNVEEAPESENTTSENVRTLNADVKVETEEVSGEVIEITDQYILIETDTGEQRRISRGGGALLSPFVRQAALGSLLVGDQVTVTIATTAILAGKVQGVSIDGALTVVTDDGQTRTIQLGQTGVAVRSNGEILLDFTTLDSGDGIELVYEGELVSDVEIETIQATAGWIVPVAIILIVIVLAAILARRGKRRNFE